MLLVTAIVWSKCVGHGYTPDTRYICVHTSGDNRKDTSGVVFMFESRASPFQKIQDYIRSIKLDSSSGPTENESRSDATAESEVKFPNEERTTQSKGKRKQLKERPLENKGNKATKRITRDSNMERESRTAAEIAELQDEATAPGEGGHTPARGGATAADSDIEGHLLSIAATSYKKLLVGMDAEEPWFVQVSIKVAVVGSGMPRPSLKQEVVFILGVGEVWAQD